MNNDAAPAAPAGADPFEIVGGWDLALLPANVRTGAACLLERRDSFARFRSLRDPGLVLGDRVRVHTWTEFNVEPAGRIDIGSDSVLVGAVFMCADRITIGERVVVSYQVTIADSENIPFLPYCIDATPLSNDFKYFFSAGQRLDAADIDRGDALARLVAAVRSRASLGGVRPAT